MDDHARLGVEPRSRLQRHSGRGAILAMHHPASTAMRAGNGCNAMMVEFAVDRAGGEMAGAHAMAGPMPPTRTSVSNYEYGAGDRTRTGKPIKAADFRHTASFKAGVVETTPFVRWTMPSPSRAGVIAARAP
ncbi:hypothetical protein [Burkholderia territorii]|uniref:hypothetical protein n=1 Tax=Burkholderia territorii TaxID=1503055 RepID=UPI0012DA883A|nr:hypothetical protein [Burkholderia territorii]